MTGVVSSAINTLPPDTIILNTPKIKVYLADALIEDDFTEIDPDTGEEVALKKYLWLDKLRIVAAPDIDVCELTYEYGRICRQGAAAFKLYPPLDITEKFIKVVIEKTFETDKEITWYGRVKAISSNVAGGGQDGASPTGTQTIVAVGLLALLNDKFVETSVIDNTAGETITIKQGLPFNFDPGGVYPARGNRSLLPLPLTGPDEDKTYVFSQEPRSKLKWTAVDAVRYLLKYHVPQDADDEPAPRWKLAAGDDEKKYLSWYDVSIHADMRTTKQVLDDLISRHRGVGYYCKFVPHDPNDPDTEDLIGVFLFSFAPEDITLPSGAILKANQKQRSCDFEESFDVVESIIGDVATSQINRVRVFGEHMTYTFTTPLYVDGAGIVEAFTKDWKQSEVDEFLDGAKETPGYSDQDDITKARWNSTARNSDQFKNIFSRFRISPLWNQRLYPPHDDLPDKFLAAPIIPDIGLISDGEVDPLYDEHDNPTGEVLWLRGLKILPRLVFRDRYDYSGSRIADKSTDHDFTDDLEVQPKFLAILVYARTEGPDVPLPDRHVVRDSDGNPVSTPPRYEHVERLNYSSFDIIGGFQWGCQISVPDTCAGIDINAHPPQMFALDEWKAGAPAITFDEHNPVLTHGLRWQDAFVTQTIESPKRVQAMEEIRAPEDGAPVTELAIYQPRARADYVVPYTTVRVENGLPIVSTTGGFIQDDRKIVSDVCRAAAEWYGDTRKTLQFTFRQVRKIFDLGWLITDIGPNYSPTPIRTPITAIEYVFPTDRAPMTRIETAYAELDVRPELGVGNQ